MDRLVTKRIHAKGARRKADAGVLVTRARLGRGLSRLAHTVGIQNRPGSANSPNPRKGFGGRRNDSGGHTSLSSAEAQLQVSHFGDSDSADNDAADEELAVLNGTALGSLDEGDVRAGSSASLDRPHEEGDHSLLDVIDERSAERVPSAAEVQGLESALPLGSDGTVASAASTSLPSLPPQGASDSDEDGVSPFSIPYQCDRDVRNLTVDELCTSSAVYNAEISWLAFNWRVLSMAGSERVPLLERLTYLGISASNLDEFFAKRVGGLKRQLEASKEDKLIKEKNQSAALTWSPDYQLELIAENVKQLSDRQTSILHDHLEPKLAEKNIHIMKRFEALSPNEQKRLSKYFTEELELLLTPIKLDPGHPFPFLQSLSIGLGVRLQDETHHQSVENAGVSYAVVTIPATVDRWIRVETGSERGLVKRIAYLPVEQLIISHLDQLFGGWTILDAWTYRVTRNAELERHEDEAEDLLEMIAEEVRERMFAPFVRLEVQQGTPSDLVDLLTQELDLNAERDVYHIESILDLSHLKSLKISSDVSLGDLKFPKYVPVPMKGTRGGLPSVPMEREGGETIFEAITRSDLFAHHPYESFESSTLRFLQEASCDPEVLAIKATVYRTSHKSPVINALRQAALGGKEVAVLMELKARFDEERNVSYAQELEAAGSSVAYGLIGLKTHCKCMLVVRKEKRGRLEPARLRTYVHIGTGNYNPVTAGLYSDFSLFSCDPRLGRDVMDVFKHLTGLHKQNAVGGYRKLLVAQVYMRQQFVRMIDREIENARNGCHAAILLKVNGLDDRELVSKLYEASRNGVRVDCIVRGMCRLRPGVEGVSENVRVISILGRYLEHHRVAVFHNAGDPQYYIGSADWMARNLSRRVEVATPVEDRKIKHELCDVLVSYLSDERDAWEMLPDGTYTQPATRSAERHRNACFVPGEDLREQTRNLMKAASSLGTQEALIQYYQQDSI